ncbi:uncharacterized protein LOC127080059 [Lathyrus oleraceus]|uniref:uncharacterized protein LOC127080059 n=1 Tax=Pisum sativum TaxID=3888 RepID=UPI0021D3B369|nr:uncharacterized protein LOC127080059 [Pisum sativum]
MFLRVTLVIGVGRDLKSRKLTPCFVVKEIHPNPSHVIQLDDIQVRENLIVENLSLRIEDREVKRLQGKDISSVKVVWGGPAGSSVTRELEIRMRESYPELFSSSNFRGRKFF